MQQQHSKKRKSATTTFSDNAFETIGNKIAKQTNVLHFVQMWGETSCTCQRALDLLDLISQSHLPRIKHTYVKPSMFGFESEEGQVEWISYKGFVETVVNKSESDQVWVSKMQQDNGVSRQCVEHYKSVVAYLVREGQFSRNLFDPKYVNFARFRATFETLYANIDPQYKAFQRSLADFKEELKMMEDNLKKLVYNDLVNQIETRGLLCEAPNHFDMDQCLSIERLNPLLYTQRQKIDFSSLGEDLKKEIDKKLEP